MGKRIILSILLCLFLSFAFIIPANAVEIGAIGTPGSSVSDYDYIVSLVANGQRLVRDVNLILHAVYFQTTGGLTTITYARSNDNGATWIGQQIVAQGNGANTFVLAPSIAVNNASPAGIFIVYNVFNSTTRETRTFIVNSSATILTTAAFSGPTQISNQLTGYVVPTDPNLISPVPRAIENYLMFDNAGLLHLAWTYINDTESYIYYANSVNGTNWVMTPTVFNTFTGEVGSDRNPRLGLDPLTNQVTLTWMSQRPPVATLPNYPDGARVALATRTAGVGGTFGAVTYESGSAANSLSYPDITFDTAGNRHLTFTELNGANYLVQYREGTTGPLTTLSASNTSLKIPIISMTTNDVPVVLYWEDPSLATAFFNSTSKMSPTVWRTPVIVQSPTNRRNASMIPIIRNDLLSAVWFERVTFNTMYAQDTDQIPPYQVASTNISVSLLGTQPNCLGDTQQISAALSVVPPGSTEVQFELRTAANAVVSTSGWITAAPAPANFTFTNVPDNTSYYVFVRARDAALNVSVDSASSNVIVVPDDTSACVSFNILIPPVSPAPGPTCAIGNFVSGRWYADDPFDVNAPISFFADADQVLPVGTAINPSPLVALTENGSFGSAIFDVTALANGSYFLEGQINGPVIGLLNAWQVAPAFAKNTGLNEIPVINITAPALANQLPTNGIYTINYQYVDTVAPASTVTLYADVDNIFGNGNEVLIGSNAAPVGAGVQNGTFNWNTTNAAGPTNYIYATISDGQCSSSIYSAGTVFVAPANSFGQRIYNFPNPFSPMTANPYQSTTNIVVRLDSPSDFDLYIFNTHGQTIYRQNITGVVGNFPNFVWDGRDSRGNIVPNGVYILKALVKNTKQVFTGRLSVLDK